MHKRPTTPDQFELIMEQEKYNLLLSILKDYYGNQHQRGFQSSPEEIAGELASLISTLVGPATNGQGLFPNISHVDQYKQNNFSSPRVNAGPLPWHQPGVREPVPQPADVCIHKLHDIAERAYRDIGLMREMLGDKSYDSIAKVYPAQSVTDIGTEDGGDHDMKKKRNREAQKRFRDRQKRKKIDLESEFNTLNDTADQIEEENIKLEQRLSLVMRTVAVSEAILLAFEGQIIRSNSILDVILPNRERTEPARNGEEVDNMLPKPSPSKHLEKRISRDISPDLLKIYQKASEMKSPDSLYLYYREWQIESKHLHSRSKNQKDLVSEELMINRMNELYQVWSINLWLYPDNFTRVFADNYPPSEKAEKLWDFLSEELCKCLKTEQLEKLQKGYHDYCASSNTYEKDINEAWNKLRKIKLASDEAVKTLRRASAMNLTVVSQAQICDSLVKSRWNNAVDFANKWVESVGPRNAFLCNTFASPHTVDWIAISKRLLDMAQNQGVLADKNE